MLLRSAGQANYVLGVLLDCSHGVKLAWSRPLSGWSERCGRKLFLVSYRSLAPLSAASARCFSIYSSSYCFFSTDSCTRQQIAALRG